MANMQFAMSALTIGAQYMGQRTQADAMERFQQDKMERTKVAAADAARIEYQGMLDRQDQVRQSAAMDVQDAMTQAAEATGSARVAAAAGGVAGGSVDEGISQFGREYEDWASRRMTNLAWEEDQIFSSMQSIRSKQEARVNSAMGDPIQDPSLIGALGQMGASAFDAAGFWGTV
jgi:hypothetical protein